MTRYQFKTEPFAHQRKALELSWNKEAFAYLMEMGTGKSKVAIDNAGILFTQQRIEAMMVLCPKSVVPVWTENELPLHCAVDAKWCAWRDKQLQRVFTHEGLRVLVMNIEALSSAQGAEEMATRFLKHNRTLLVLDESTTIKSYKAMRTKAALRLAKHAIYRRIMSGFPAPNGPLDLWSQYEFLHRSCLGHQSYFSFRNTYAILRPLQIGPRTIKRVVGYRNQEKLAAALKPYSYRVRKDECLDLPPKTYTRRVVELTDEQRKHYIAMKKLAYTELEGKRITVDLVLTQLLRLHQIVCGHLPTENGVTAIASKRIDALFEVLDETEGQAIIWANYLFDIALISEELAKRKESFVTMTGTTQDRGAVVEKFQNGSARYFIGNTQTGGKGLTLTAAQTVIYYSNNFNLDDRVQSEDRAHRSGQRNPVTYVDLVAEEAAVDRQIVKALNEKRALGAQLVGDQWKEWM